MPVDRSGCRVHAAPRKRNPTRANAMPRAMKPMTPITSTGRPGCRSRSTRKSRVQPDQMLKTPTPAHGETGEDDEDATPRHPEQGLGDAHRRLSARLARTHRERRGAPGDRDVGDAVGGVLEPLEPVVAVAARDGTGEVHTATTENPTTPTHRLARPPTVDEIEVSAPVSSAVPLPAPQAMRSPAQPIAMCSRPSRAKPVRAPELTTWCVSAASAAWGPRALPGWSPGLRSRWLARSEAEGVGFEPTMTLPP